MWQKATLVMRVHSFQKILRFFSRGLKAAPTFLCSSEMSVLEWEERKGEERRRKDWKKRKGEREREREIKVKENGREREKERPWWVAKRMTYLTLL